MQGNRILRLSDLKLALDHDAAELKQAICRHLGIPPEALLDHTLVKRSVDARRKDAISLVYCLDLHLRLDRQAALRLRRRFKGDPRLRIAPDESYHFVAHQHPTASLVSKEDRPIVVGAGPCGYFAALLLAQMGLRPLLMERGRPVRERSRDTFGFWKGSLPFDPDSNVQFGEGGAGTFSDGKLYSQVSEASGYVRKVLEELVAAGANAEILTHHHPHIGTFKLATVVRGLRTRIETLGGEVRFDCRVEELDLEPGADRRVCGVLLADGRRIPATQVVLAPGHSARDTFQALHRQGVAMRAKPFAMGLRIEHPQVIIDRARWGEAAGHPKLGAAEYKLVHHASGGRTVYSFCMCPGGLVVGATSEAGCVVTNGMSQHSRNERNANSALVVNVEIADLEGWGDGSSDPLAGVAFQRHWERRAFEAGGGAYRAPAQWLGDFQAGRPSEASAGGGHLLASYLPGIQMGSLDGCLPDFVLAAIREALPVFASRIPEYTMPGALLTGVETRTSSPLTLVRDARSLESINTPGLYPAGEGAGHAGGILSAAIDGIKVAEAVAIRRLHPRRRGAPDGSACDQA